MNVLGIDLSTKQLDLAYVDENEDIVHTNRCFLEGENAWNRTLSIGNLRTDGLMFDDVYLVAIEAPYGRGQAGTNALLNRVVGAVAAAVPARLRRPESCWIVRPDEWKSGLGLNRKPTVEDVRLRLRSRHSWESGLLDDQNARDAACLALWARDVNAAAISRVLSGAA